jgi:nucleoside-diphosphate-sugar epimerase
MNRVLITGAGGGIGRSLRESLKGVYPVLRLSDRIPLAPAREGEEVDCTELADKAAVRRMVDGVDAIVQLGGVSAEDRWEPILESNIVGLYNLFEGAREAGVKRIVFATSNHAVGFYPRKERIDHRVPPRQPLRRQQGVRRGAREPLQRQARHRRFQYQDRQFRSAPDRQAATFDLGEPARSRAARAHRDRASGGPL